MIQMTAEQGIRFRQILAQLRAESPADHDCVLRTMAFFASRRRTQEHDR